MISFSNKTIQRRSDPIRCVQLCLGDFRKLSGFRGEAIRVAQSSSIRFLSIPAANTDESQKRLVKALYREMMAWCKTTSNEIPLASFIPPPMTLEPPLLDKHILEQLATKHRDDGMFSRHSFPQVAVFESKHLLAPLHNVKDLQALIRAVFRLNISPTASVEVEQFRIRAAFDTVKLLNTLTSSLNDLREKRNQHLDRDGVFFRVGQGTKEFVKILGREHAGLPNSTIAVQFFFSCATQRRELEGCYCWLGASSRDQ